MLNTKSSKNSESVPILSENDKISHNYGSVPSSSSSSQDNRLNYPKAVAFVLCSKLFESFAANGVRTVLALYLRDSLDFTEESSTSFYHIFNFFSQFCPIFGAVLADSYFGNAKTIFYLFFLYSIGWIGIVTITYPFEGLPMAPLVMSSLILISIGNGSIRACITSLGGQQFQLPQQSKQLHQYFSLYYFIYSAGIMFSKIIPPAIRAQTQCFGKSDCYFAVFGSLSSVFLAAWFVFLIGMFFYKDEEIDKAEGNIFFQVIGCVSHGAVRKVRGCTFRASTHNSWIDGSIGRYQEQFVHDVSAFLKVLKLFIPLPIYWALFAQIDSSWTFQSAELNTTIAGYHFQADQAKAVSAFMLLILIPLWHNLIVPTLLIYNIKISPLRSVTFGGITAAVSYICAGILQLQIEANHHRMLESSSSGIEKISILWQLPQFFFIMMGEVLLSIPGLQFSFTQAPPSMKSVLTAAWYCNNAFGNLIVVAITEWQPFKQQSKEYFFYATLMFVAMVIFEWIARNYRYTEYSDFSEIEKGKTSSLSKSKSTQNGCFYKSQEGLDLIL